MSVRTIATSLSLVALGALLCASVLLAIGRLSSESSGAVADAPSSTTEATGVASPVPTPTTMPPPAAAIADAAEVAGSTLPAVPAPAPAPAQALSSSGPGFTEIFDGNAGLDRLTYGVYHRGFGQQTNGIPVELWGSSGGWDDGTGTWTGDHDASCDDPTTQRPLQSTDADLNPDEVVYTCRDHVMTSMGEVDGYSIVWFSPDADQDHVADVFSGVDTVSWDVNVTDLGGRQWWEMSIVPVGAPFLATEPELAGVANIDTYDVRSVVVGNGPSAREPRITTQGQQHYTEWLAVCGSSSAYNPEACGSKAIRLPFSVTDNHDGTVTVQFGGLFTQTVPGEFPADGFNVYFKDHNYTPDKDGPVIGHTWHWDNIVVA